MTQIFNKHSELNRRRKLRANQNKAEEIVWSILRNRQINGYKFRRQFSIDIFFLDFYCPEINLAIEIDGNSHDNEDAKKRDAERQLFIENLGIKFIRFKNEEVYNNLDSIKKNISETIINLIKK